MLQTAQACTSQAYTGQAYTGQTHSSEAMESKEKQRNQKLNHRLVFVHVRIVHVHLVLIHLRRRFMVRGATKVLHHFRHEFHRFSTRHIGKFLLLLLHFNGFFYCSWHCLY